MLLALGVGCRRMESSQGECVDEVVGGLDRHGHGGAEDRLRPLGVLEGLGMPPMEEGQDLLHDVMEDDARSRTSPSRWQRRKPPRRSFCPPTRAGQSSFPWRLATN